ncbi:MAG: response regulator [Ruminococcus sp.]|jgi:signal transduction histidine kinase/AmiR/NasT family two-component response regulator|nr:response regulator [Ruminococcus sp.]
MNEEALLLEVKRLKRQLTKSEQQLIYTSRISAQHENLSGLLRDKLERTVCELKQATAAKSEFLSKMSHEIRTPLNAVIGFSELAQKTHDTEKIHSYLEKIERSSNFLLGIINDILDFSKIESGKMELSPTDFDFHKMLDELTSIISFRINEKHQQFKLQIEDDTPQVLYADTQRLQQVLTNLLSNSCKFTPDGGRISLSVETLSQTEHDAVIRFNVKDTGIGISPENISKLFKSFSQAELETSRIYGGTGLGLAISQNIVRMMGGEIIVESAPGEGSLFYFTITLPKGTVKRSPDENISYILPNLSGESILLVDDNEINREIVMAILEETEVKIDCAVDGIEAVQMFKTSPEKYMLIFMDVQMPRMNGLDASKAIRDFEKMSNAERRVPIIAMTAAVFKEDIEKCLNAGMDSHIGKPINIDELSSQISTQKSEVRRQRSEHRGQMSEDRGQSNTFS